MKHVVVPEVATDEMLKGMLDAYVDSECGRFPSDEIYEAAIAAAPEPVYSRRQLEAENAELRAQVAKLIQERDLNHKQILSLQERLPPLREIRPIGGDYRRGKNETNHI